VRAKLMPSLVFGAGRPQSSPSVGSTSLREKIRRQRDFFGVVTDRKIGRHDVRIVRRIEWQIAEKRPAFLLLQKADRLVRKDRARRFGREHRRRDFALGDVGQNKLEMVYRVERGGNYGWRLKEGAFKFLPTGAIDSDLTGLPPGLSGPIFQYDRDEGTSVIGGHVYRGKAFPALSGKYVFGDYRHGKSSSGRLFTGDLATGEIRELRIGKIERELGFLLKGFGVDADGEIYACGSAQAGPTGTGVVVVKLIPSAP